MGKKGVEDGKSRINITVLNRYHNVRRNILRQKEKAGETKCGKDGQPPNERVNGYLLLLRIVLIIITIIIEILYL